MWWGQKNKGGGGNPVTCNNMDKLQEHSAKWNKPVTKDCVIPLLCIWSSQNHRNRKKEGSYQGLGVGGKRD